MKKLLQFFFISCLIAYGYGANLIPPSTCDTNITNVLAMSNVTCNDATLAGVRRILQPCLNNFGLYVSSLSVSNYNTDTIRDYVKTLFEKSVMKTLVADYSELKRICTLSNLVEICVRQTVANCTNTNVKAELQKAIDGEMAFRLSAGTGYCKPRSCMLNPIFTNAHQKCDLSSCLSTDAFNELKTAHSYVVDILQREGYKVVIPSSTTHIFSVAHNQRPLLRGAIAHCDLVRTLSNNFARILKKYEVKNNKKCNLWSRKVLSMLTKIILPPGCLKLGRGPPDHNNNFPVVGHVEATEPTSDDNQDPIAKLQETEDSHRNIDRVTIFFGLLRQNGNYEDMTDSEPKFGICNDVRTDGVYYTMLEVDQLKLETKFITIPGRPFQFHSAIKISVLSKTFDVATTAILENGVQINSFSNGVTEMRSTCDNRPITFEKVEKGVAYIIRDKCTGLYVKCRHTPYTESSTLYFYSCVVRGPNDLLGRQGRATGDLMTGCFSENDASSAIKSRRKRDTTSVSSGNTMSQSNQYANNYCSANCGTAVASGNAAVLSDIKEAQAADSYMTAVATAGAAQHVFVIFSILVTLVNHR